MVGRVTCSYKTHANATQTWVMVKGPEIVKRVLMPLDVALRMMLKIITMVDVGPIGCRRM